MPLTSDAALAESKALIDRAKAAGYTGVAFWESFDMLSDPSWPRQNGERLRAALAYAGAQGLRVMALGAPFGWSNGALHSNGNLAEAQRVIGAEFEVDRAGQRLNFLDSFPGLRNGGFESGLSDWFDTNDSGIGVNQASHSGRQAAVIVDPPGHARLRQKITLTPWRQYHLSLWFKSSELSAKPSIEVLDRDNNEIRFLAYVEARGSHEWTRLEYSFNSQETRSGYLYLGVWGACSGVLWFDDVRLEETALVYVARRGGAPLRMYAASDSRTVYREGTDFAPIRDLRLGPPQAAFRDVYHAPPVVELPAGTILRPGDRVKLDFYAVFPLPLDNQVGMCLTEPAVFRWLEGNAGEIRSILPGKGALLLSYDEMRQMNSCASCRAKKMTAGELLAWNVGRTARIYRAALPGVPLFVWSDMFDPYHNAKSRYGYVEGDLAGSWTGLPPDVAVLNWDHQHLEESLRWFAGENRRQPTPHEQVLAGYYDSGDGKSAERDLARAHGVDGLQGVMYITWRDDYSQLESFAASARRAWQAYTASIGPNRRP